MQTDLTRGQRYTKLDKDRDEKGWQLSKAVMVVSITLFLGGCASYQASPLPVDSILPDKVEKLAGSAVIVQKKKQSEGLTLHQIASLALYNNPDLKARRLQLNVADAELYSASLFPDPQLSTNIDWPMNTATGVTNAWGLGLGYDIMGLITHQAQLDVKRNAKSQVKLQLLWQEWQVIQQARSLAVRSISEQKQLTLLQQTLALYQQRYERSSKALTEGDVTLDINGTDLTAFVDTSSRLNQLMQLHNETRHSLNQLLGLAPDVPLDFKSLPDLTLIDTNLINGYLASLSKRRPDLLALQKGYESQEAQVREAILSQFPAINIGMNRATDTAGLATAGLNISLNLPLFSGNRGVIAIQRASRDQLKAEYEARLIQTTIDVDKLADLQSIITQQQGVLNTHLPQLRSIVEHARTVYQQGDIDALTFLNLETTWINKQLENINLEQLQWENYTALQTALGLPDITDNVEGLQILDDTNKEIK